MSKLLKPARAGVAGELDALDVDAARPREVEVGVGELRDLLHRHVPLLALEVLALLLPLEEG
jgi:hypothetical protein